MGAVLVRATRFDSSRHNLRVGRHETRQGLRARFGGAGDPPTPGLRLQHRELGQVQGNIGWLRWISGGSELLQRRELLRREAGGLGQERSRGDGGARKGVRLRGCEVWLSLSLERCMLCARKEVREEFITPTSRQ